MSERRDTGHGTRGHGWELGASRRCKRGAREHCMCGEGPVSLRVCMFPVTTINHPQTHAIRRQPEAFPLQTPTSPERHIGLISKRTTRSARQPA